MSGVSCIISIDYGYVFIFLFKQKTAYEMRISDWSSDVCSSDLEMLAGDEHHDEIGRVVELIPIVFVTEHVDVRAHRRRVRGELRALLVFVHRAARVLIGVERHFGVHDEVLAARHLHHDTRTKPPAIADQHPNLGLENGMYP